MSKSAKIEGVIMGRVTTVDGLAVAGAIVLITGDSPSHRDIAALTNMDGTYRLDDLVVGRYTVLVRATGYVPDAKQARVEAGQVTRLDFSLVKST